MCFKAVELCTALPKISHIKRFEKLQFQDLFWPEPLTEKNKNIYIVKTQDQNLGLV